MMAKEEILFLSQHVGLHMLRRLEWMTLQPEIIIEMNSQKGVCAELLQKRYPKAKIVSLTTDEIEIITLPEQSVDLIFANMTIPWCHDLKKMLYDCRRLLRLDGLFIFSSLGPDTLQELRAEFADAILIHLMDMHDIGDELIHARFQDPVLDVDSFQVTYRQCETLIAELQSMHILAEDLTLRQLEANSEGLFNLTYEVIYGHAWGPSVTVDNTADEDGVVKIPLSHLRRSNKHFLK